MAPNTCRLDGTSGRVPNHSGSAYRIRILGRLEEHWLDWFDGMALRYLKERQTGLELTELRGMFADQPALHGVLTKIRDLNLILVSVSRIAPTKSRGPKRPPRRG